MIKLSDNGVSSVFCSDDFVYKIQPKHFADNEEYALRLLEDTGYVPELVERLNPCTVMMELIETTSVTDPDEFMSHFEPVLESIHGRGLRHDDLTTYAVLVRDNRPIIIDWAESRIFCDPRPSKRPEGDRYWLEKTMRELCER